MSSTVHAMSLFCGIFFATVPVVASYAQELSSDARTFNASEAAEVTSILIWLLTEERGDLESKLAQLPPYHQVLLTAWVSHHVFPLLDAARDLSPAPDGPGETPEFLDEFHDARMAAIIGIGRGADFATPEEYHQFLGERANELSDAVLTILKKYVDGFPVSATFAEAAVGAVVGPWWFLPADVKAKKLEDLEHYLGIVEDRGVRMALIQAVFASRMEDNPVLKQAMHDPDPAVARLSAFYVLNSGDRLGLRPYIQAMWRLREEEETPSSPPEDILTRFVEDAPDLQTEQEQLAWLREHEKDLVWDEVEDIYIFRTSLRKDLDEE